MTKTRKFLIVSHGGLANGFRSALELITGAAGEVIALEAYLEENKPVEDELAQLLAGAGHSSGTGGAAGAGGGPSGADDAGGGVQEAGGAGGGSEVGGSLGPDGAGGDELLEEWVVFTDLLGGSITNQVLRVAAGLPGREHIHVVAGVNLPLVIEVVLGDPERPVAELLADAVAGAREQLVYVNRMING